MNNYRYACKRAAYWAGQLEQTERLLTFTFQLQWSSFKSMCETLDSLHNSRHLERACYDYWVAIAERNL